ncbi:DUF6882 domain-containing protein [Janthinobacterium lividum]
MHFKNSIVASASIQVVGTYNRSDGTFLWGWDQLTLTCYFKRSMHY